MEGTYGASRERGWSASSYTRDVRASAWTFRLALGWRFAAPSVARASAPVPEDVPNVGVESPVVLPPPSATDLLARFGHEPTLRQVQTWAETALHAGPQTIDRWLRNARRFAWLPEVTLQTDLALQEDQGFDYLDLEGLSPTPGVDVVAVNDDIDVGIDRDLTIRLSWDLDELVMSHERIRAAAEARQWVTARRELLASVGTIYVERRRLQVSRLLAAPADTLQMRVERELRIMELTGALDAATAGAFSKALGPPVVR